MIIMPSTPRLSTPARSVTSSPAAASSNGVEAAITERMMASVKPMRGLSRRADKADAVKDHRIAGEDVEQQNSLEYLGEIERNLHGDLRVLAADEGECKKQACNKDADRVQTPKEGDDDGGEAIARPAAGGEVGDGAAGPARHGGGRA